MSDDLRAEAVAEYSQLPKDELVDLLVEAGEAVEKLLAGYKEMQEALAKAGILVGEDNDED
jgi:hypothetical protein